MNVYRLSVAIALVSALAGCGGGGSSTSEQPGTVAVDYFPLEVGNGWSFSDGSSNRVITSLVLRGQKTFQVGSRDGNGTTDEYYQKTSSAVTLVPGSDADALGPVTLMRLPVRPGDSYVAVDRNLDGLVDVDNDGFGDYFSVHADVSVIDIAPLTTSVGTLADTAHLRTVVTQKIRSSATGEGGTITQTSDDWYAPGIGPVKNTTVIKNLDGSTSTSSREIRQYHIGSLRSASTSPVVVATNPASGSTVSSAMISVVFGEDMDTLKTSGLGLTLSDAAGHSVAGQPVWDDSRTLRFQPAQALNSGAYSARLSAGAENLAGNTVTTTQGWDFHLDKDGPVLVGITPADGAGEASPDTSIRITFDEPVDLTSAQSRITLRDDWSIDNVAVTLSLEGNTVVLKPTAPLILRRSYNVTVWPGVADLVGNSSASNARTRFTIEPGWFALAKTVPELDSVSLSSHSVAADFDGDGHADLAVETANNPYLIRVLPGRGDGTFGTPRDFDGSDGVHALFAADIDGDGRAELISIGSRKLQQWHWDATGQVTEKPMPAVPAGMSLGGAAVLRIAADGQRLGLVAEDVIGGQRMLWRQSAPGIFVTPTALPAVNSAYQHLALAGDINGDGRDDLVYAGPETGDMLVLLQQADGSFAAGPAIAGLPNSTRYRLVDFNGDGRADITSLLFAANYGSDAIGVLLQQADHSFVAGPVLDSGCDNCGPDDFVAADLDGNGRVDFVVIATNIVSFLRQAADGSVAAPDVYTRSGTYGSLALADFNSDGRLDVMAGENLLLQRAASANGTGAARRGVLTQRYVRGVTLPGSKR